MAAKHALGQAAIRTPRIDPPVQPALAGALLTRVLNSPLREVTALADRPDAEDCDRQRESACSARPTR